MKRFSGLAIVVTAAALAMPAPVLARDLLLASTTSTENSGLFAYLLPIFEANSGIKTRVIAVGTGQALRLARNGDADMLLVHDPVAEKQFVADGFGTDRRQVMYNDFVLIGPKGDPAGVKGRKDVLAALKLIAETRAIFVSRGDDSGTHRAEQRHWAAAAVDTTAGSGKWYREAGAGMGATLNIASGMDGYVISDRATWINFRNKGDLSILVEGDPRLFNQYGVILVDPARHPHVNVEAAKQLSDWLTSPAGQDSIAAFEVGGKQLFFPNFSKEPGS